MTVILAIISLVLALGCYVIGELARQGQLKWSSKNDFGFWGTKSDLRKYKNFNREDGEAFLFSTTLLVAVTDGYHQMQFWMFNFLSLAFALPIGKDWWFLLIVLTGIRIIHWALRETFKKDKI